MPISNKIPNQANYQDSQNFNIDIEKIFTDFIQEIDATRSTANITNPVNQAIINSLGGSTISRLEQSLKVERTPQESRLHAFYRLIGFPVVSNDQTRFYNPGFDKIFVPNRTIKLEDKISIANKPIKGFQEISSNRETYSNVVAKIFATNKTISASVVALSSGVFTRPFVFLDKEDDDPFVFSLVNQTYQVEDRGLIGFNKNVALSDYVDEFGSKCDLALQRSHILKPFMVDPRIDFTVSPADRRVAIPFVLNKSDLMIRENSFVKRPLIEKVIRDRLTVQDQKNTLGSADQSFVDYIQSVPAVRDENLIKQMASGNVYKLGDQIQFIKYFNIIRTMCSKLVEAQKKIQQVQSRYYWLPIPSITGPEGGNEIKPVIISKNLPDDFITRADRSIIVATLKQAANQFNSQTASVSGTPDSGGFAFESFATTTFDQDASEAYGNNIEKQLNSLNKLREHEMAAANGALRTIEIIMGEFSGLGLCDIVAIMGALYVMDEKKLLGFLDADAHIRMRNAPELDAAKTSASNIIDAHKEFWSRVRDFYHIMDKIYKDLRHSNGLPD
jgi:hypothetical protein